MTRTCFVLVSLTLASSLAGAAAPGNNTSESSDPTASSTLIEAFLNITDFEIAKENEQVDPSSQNQADTQWLSVLRFRNSSVRIPLMMDRSDTEAGGNLDPASIKTSWLQRPELLSIEWRDTPNAGSGAYTVEAHVLVMLKGGEAKDVLRDSFLASCSQGAGFHKSCHACFSCEGLDEKNAIRVRRRVTETRQETLFKDAPLAVESLRVYTLVEDTFFSLANGVLVQTSRDTWLDLDYEHIPDLEIPEYKIKKTPLNEVASFLAVLLGQRRWTSDGPPEATAEEMDAMKKALIELNPGIDTTDDIKTLVKIPAKKSLIPPMTSEDDFFPFRGL